MKERVELKKDSTVSLSQNDANSPRCAATTDTPMQPLDFENKDGEDFFTPLEYPVQKRSLSNGDEFFNKQSEVETKLAMTASDPDSSGQQSSLSNDQKRLSKPSDETKSNTDESKSQEALSVAGGNSKKDSKKQGSTILPDISIVTSDRQQTIEKQFSGQKILL